MKPVSKLNTQRTCSHRRGNGNLNPPLLSSTSTMTEYNSRRLVCAQARKVTAARPAKPTHKDLFFIIKAGYSVHPALYHKIPLHTLRAGDDWN